MTLKRQNNKLAYSYFKHLWNRTQWYKYNNAISITGNAGSGKTVWAVISAFVVNPRRFNENSYVNTAKEFIQAVDESNSGDSIVWDELGASLSARRWHSLSNILTAEVLQTYRARKLSVFFVVPDISFVDVQARKLMTAFCEVKRYNNMNSVGWLYNIIIARKTGDTYFKSYRGLVDGHMIRMQKLRMPRKIMKKIPKEIWKNIRTKEQRFKRKIRQKSLGVIRQFEKKDFIIQRTIYDMINEVKKNKGKFINKKGKLDTYLIQTDFGIGRHKAKQIKKFIENR